MSNALSVPQVLARPRRRTVIVVALWIAVAAAVAVRERVMLAHPLPPGVPWLESGNDRYFLDFRDTIWTPGRFLLEGGNPYDPQSYQAAYPWALAFSLYAPVWLVLAAALAPLPYLASIIVFQVISLAVAILMLTVLFRWTLPDHVDLAVPVALLWMNVWYPGRGALSVQLTTLLAVIGLTLVLRSVCQPQAESATTIDRSDDRAGAWGVALSLLKPQFGTMAIVAPRRRAGPHGGARRRRAGARIPAGLRCVHPRGRRAYRVHHLRKARPGRCDLGAPSERVDVPWSTAARSPGASRSVGVRRAAGLATGARAATLPGHSSRHRGPLNPSTSRGIRRRLHVNPHRRLSRHI
jgi:hypothetical protein